MKHIVFLGIRNKRGPRRKTTAYKNNRSQDQRNLFYVYLLHFFFRFILSFSSIVNILFTTMVDISNSINQIVDSVKDINLSSRQQQTLGVIAAATAVTSFSLYKLFFQVLIYYYYTIIILPFSLTLCFSLFTNIN